MTTFSAAVSAASVTTNAGGSTAINGATIDPSGTFLLAANQNSDTVVVFRIDQKTGKLTPTGHTIEVGAPVALKFVPVK